MIQNHTSKFVTGKTHQRPKHAVSLFINYTEQTPSLTFCWFKTPDLMGSKQLSLPQTVAKKEVEIMFHSMYSVLPNIPFLQNDC